MAILHVTYQEGNKSVSGILVEADVLKTKIRMEDNQVITVNSEFVTLKDVDVTSEYSIDWLEHIAEHYQNCEITDVEK